jgi:hypothetical protein
MKGLPVALLAVLAAPASAAPALPDDDRTRVAEAFLLADAVGNRLWPDWDKAPFAVLLVTPEYEFLIRHPKPSADFTPLGEDKVLKCGVSYRKRTFPPNLLATFPAVGGTPTVVIGQPANTAAKAPTRWVITLLHEHFHQLQTSQPRYYPDVDALGLARGDTTGMWMLNYPFPYTAPEVKRQFAAMTRALAEALRARGPEDFARKLTAYLGEKKKFRALLRGDDYKYFSFQLWQEGVARYTEYHVALLAADGYKPGPAFQGLKDFRPYQEEARAVLAGIEKELTSLELDRAKREAFYAVGAAEGLLLDRANRGWRKRYFEDKFSLDAHFRPAP